MRSVFHYLARLAYPHGSVRTVLRGPLRSMRYVVRPGMAATLALGMDNLNLPFLSKKVRKGQVVWDVGANCGQMALFFSRAVGTKGQVLAFEPVRENFHDMQKNLGLNDITNVRCFEVALSRTAGTRRMLFDPARHTMGVFEDASVKMNGWTDGMEVRCDSIDRLIEGGEPAPDVLKIDVEGAAADVVAGGISLIETKRPAIYLELHALARGAPELLLLDDLQTRFGYRITDIDGTLHDEPGEQWGAAVWCEPAP